MAALDEDRALIATWPWDGASVGADVGYDAGLELGPSVEIPLRLFDPSGPRHAAITAIEAELRHRAVGVRRDAIRDVRTAVADDVAARRALDLIDRSLIPSLERRRLEIERAHRAGEAPIVELLLADRELKDARASRVDLEARVLAARIRLERAAGGPAAAPLRKPEPPKSVDGGTER